MTPDEADTDELDIVLRSMWDLSVDMLVTAGADGCLTRVSPSWSTALGHTPDELLTVPYLDFVHPDDVEHTRTQTRALTEPDAVPVTFENRFRAKDGQYRRLAWTCWTGGDGRSFHGVVRDVTSAHEAAERYQGLLGRLEDRELMLDAVVHHNLALIYVKDLDGRYLVYNRAFAEAFELTARAAAEGVGALDVLLGRDDTWLDPELAPVWRRNDLRAALEPHFVEEWSDHPVWGRLTYDTMKFPLLNAAGDVYATCGVSVETTERTRLIAGQKDAEELFRSAFENSPIGKALVNPSGRIFRSNKALARILGCDLDTLLDRPVAEVFTPAYAARVDALGDDTGTGAESPFEEQLTLVSGGATMHLHVSTSAARTETAELIYSILQVQDVTARVEAAEAQRASEARFRSLFTHASVGVVEALPDGQILSANPYLCRMLGYAEQELVGQPDTLISGGADEPPELRTPFGGVPADGADEYSVARDYLCKDGRAVPALVNVGVVRDEGGTVERLVATVVDMTDQRTAERALRDAHTELGTRQAFMESVLDSVDSGVLACDSDGRVVLRNEAQRRLMGVGPHENPTPEELMRRLRILREDGTRLTGRDLPLYEALRGTDEPGARMQVVREGEAPVQLRVTARQVRDDTGSILGAVSAFTDLTEEREIQARLKDGAAFHDAVLAATPDLIYVSDPRTHETVWVSRSLFDVLGYTEEHELALGAGMLQSIVHPEDLARVEQSHVAARALDDGEVLELRYRVRHATGDMRWLARRVTPFSRAEDGTVTQVLSVARDVTDVVEVEERLGQAALHDALTGLPNRTLLADRLRAAVSRVQRTGGRCAVLMIDLDGFKRVNDTSGHAAGDEVLRTVAERITGALRAGDTVARLGGDEFAIILEPSTAPPSDGEDLDVTSLAETAAQRVRRVVREPIIVGEAKHVVTASIGIRFAGAGTDPDALLRDADAAMYRAKTSGRDRSVVYDDELRSGVAERRRIEALLLDALATLDAPSADGPRLTVAYQAIFDLAADRVVGVEALARLDDEDGLPVSPEEFISVAEETGQIGALGRHVLGVACRDLAGWRREHPRHRDLGVAVNLSARQAGHSTLYDEVVGTLRDTGVPPHLLTLELTETVLLSAARSTLKGINALHELGIRIAIDDFGTGYASLRYLTELPVSSVKVDRTFTAGLLTDPTSASIVRAIAGLATELDLACVVEGIETEDQRAALPAGVLGQGFLLARPLTSTEFGAFLGRSPGA